MASYDQHVIPHSEEVIEDPEVHNAADTGESESFSFSITDCLTWCPAPSPSGWSTWPFELLAKWSPIKTSEYHSDSYEVNMSFFSLLFVSLILLVSLLPPSFHYIDYDTYGLLRNNYGDVHLTPTYGPGRYFQPLSFSYVEFPATYQAVEMSTVR